MLEELQLRLHGAATLPTLVYLPGLHGDWTLVGDFRRHLAGKVRFVEFIYPRTLTWTLDDYAVAVENALAQNGITSGWLLGESYGSQIVWALVAHKQFSVHGIILAGGFVKYPLRWGVRLVRIVFGLIPFKLLAWLVAVYGKLARFRYRHSPETLASIDVFIARRTELDRQAMSHRLDQIAEFDPREIARSTSLPIYNLSGWFDPVVPCPVVRRWLRKNSPSLRGEQTFYTADHNILATAHAKAARQILTWMRS